MAKPNLYSLFANRPIGQVAAIVRQLSELVRMAQDEEIAFDPEQPVAIGISGGRLRLAFMHPDMARFFGPAWQMPIGAADESGSEQIVLIVQAAEDHRLHLYPSNLEYRESVNSLSTANEKMVPSAEIVDLYQYEQFGTAMSESLLLELGYFSDAELNQRRQENLPLPPPSRWISNNMRRPFALVGNAIASLRTVRDGLLGEKVDRWLGEKNFAGLRLLSTGEIPPGGFSSSSAVTVATLNALNALYKLDMDNDQLVHLACQSEYGTGVRAGSLDQATEQKGEAGIGTLISSNPRDNYRTLGRYPVPTEQIQILFPYSVERDSEAWRWSWGAYAPTVAPTGPLTAGEMRTLTGKAAELAAILTRLPINRSFFQQIEAELIEAGQLGVENSRWICSILRQAPLFIKKDLLRQQLDDQKGWLIDQYCKHHNSDRSIASQQADATVEALFTGWRDPWHRQSTLPRSESPECGVPLRAMLAYLFGEVAKNFYLIHHPDEWIQMVTLSQRGDRSVQIEPDNLPTRKVLEAEQRWEHARNGPERLNGWLERYGAIPFDFNQGLSDAELTDTEPPHFHRLMGSNFFRGLALIDLVEAMLKQAFGNQVVAVRINAAGQGGYFQVHVDKRCADPEEVKQFLRLAFYRRFGLSPRPEFVEVHPGGGAIGLRLERYADLPAFIELCRRSGSLSD
ncbi:MAG: hypothetical protein AAF702_44710 [Chloroflexota bacterium]